MDRNVLLILFFYGFCIPSSHVLRVYHYVNVPMKWAEARNYCREHFDDLATFESLEDIKGLDRPALDTQNAWIGLNDDPRFWKDTMGRESNSWRWSATGETSQTGYQAWSSDEPDNLDLQYCVVMHLGEWHDWSCASKESFVCYSETNQSYVYVHSVKNWTEARDYCRKYLTDLPTIENASESIEVINSIPFGFTVWIGLYRVPWIWSDGSKSSLRNWKDKEPNNVGGRQHCVSENEQQTWDDDTCVYDRSFICQQELTVKTTVTMKIKMDADMTDPDMNTQILQQLSVALKGHGLTDFKLRWKTEPKKQKKKLAELQCNEMSGSHTNDDQ